MKYLYCGLLILCLLLGACWLSGREIGRRSEAVALPLEGAVSALRAGDNDELTRLQGIEQFEYLGSYSKIEG